MRYINISCVQARAQHDALCWSSLLLFVDLTSPETKMAAGKQTTQLLIIFGQCIATVQQP